VNPHPFANPILRGLMLSLRYAAIVMNRDLTLPLRGTGLGSNLWILHDLGCRWGLLIQRPFWTGAG